VYIVHNRVESIYSLANFIQKIAPKARVGVGHGQLGEKELETVMTKFMHHEFDVLVATTIIENGLDIPLANTLIVNRADRYGLSQLYQLRGRVGRSNRRAYAYLLIPSDETLTQIARRGLRLSTNSANWARGSESPLSTWSCAAPGTCLAASSTVTSKPSASTCTVKCWKEPLRSSRQARCCRKLKRRSIFVST